MSVEENKAVTRRMYDALNRRDFDALQSLLADDYIEHNSNIPVPLGKQAVIGALKELHDAVPDLRRTLDVQIGEGDRVADRVEWSGTFEKEFRGAPPGSRLSLTAMVMYRLRDGQLVECLWMTDRLAMFENAGAPPPGYVRAQS